MQTGQSNRHRESSRPSIGDSWRESLSVSERLAEGEGFEPPVGLLLRLISSQVPSTTQPPFRSFPFNPSSATNSASTTDEIACLAPHSRGCISPESASRASSFDVPRKHPIYRLRQYRLHQGRVRPDPVQQARRILRQDQPIALRFAGALSCFHLSRILSLRRSCDNRRIAGLSTQMGRAGLSREKAQETQKILILSHFMSARCSSVAWAVSAHPHPRPISSNLRDSILTHF